MIALYNEIDPFAASWLEQLVSAGHIGPGRVERRSITELKPDDVAGPGQRHFFAGIGGWSYALRLAGVPDDADIWTGSCPCQPFSSAGKRSGTSDPRHLWPAWFALIEQCRPPIIFGEQVASIDGLAWLDTVYADLERCGYAVGASDLCAAGVGAPHIRQRLYFVAYADGDRPQARNDGRTQSHRGRSIERGGRLGDSDRVSGWRYSGAVPRTQAQDSSMRRGDHGPWTPGQDVDWLECLDGNRRPVPAEPALFPLANGVPNRVGLLRGSGNAIVPQVAAIFIQAAFEAMTTPPSKASHE